LKTVGRGFYSLARNKFSAIDCPEEQKRPLNTAVVVGNVAEASFFIGGFLSVLCGICLFIRFYRYLRDVGWTQYDAAFMDWRLPLSPGVELLGFLGGFVLLAVSAPFLPEGPGPLFDFTK
jgi:hypothetical protein